MPMFELRSQSGSRCLLSVGAERCVLGCFAYSRSHLVTGWVAHNSWVGR